MKSLKLLFVGNSFAVDTMEHAANVALSLGVEDVHFGVLYVGGCSIGMHYDHAMRDLGVYIYYTNDGNGWSETPDFKISDAVKSEEWDWIAIQHGSCGTNRYTSPECYEHLGGLIDYIKSLANKNAKIAFNLTWIGEPTFDHHELISYGRDVALMRKKLEEVTEKMVLCNPKVDLLVPTGTAIENARTSDIGILTRDGYHLSLDKGRYIAALTLVSTVTGISADKIEWMPDGVDGYARQIAIESVKNAQKAPLTVTKSSL